MRIISQDGKYDYPYENSTLFIDYMDGRAVKIVPSTGGYKGSNIATYSTEEKAVKAMEMLRKTYAENFVVFQNVEPTDDLIEAFKRYRTEIIRVSIDNRLADIKFKNHQNFCFQFPRDEEIEV